MLLLGQNLSIIIAFFCKNVTGSFNIFLHYIKFVCQYMIHNLLQTKL